MLPSGITAIAWRFTYYRQAPYQYLRNTNSSLGSSTIAHTLLHLVTQPTNLSSPCTLRVPIIPYQHHNYQVKNSQLHHVTSNP